nr:uncharacterized protein LOC129275753 [Lytechinus pictus]
MAPVRSRLEIQFRPRTCNSAHGGELKDSNCSTAPLHRPLRIQLRSKAKLKNDEEYCNSANWRKRMKKNDPTKYKDILERDRLYSRVRNASLNEEQRARERVLTKERVRQFRQRKKEKEAEKGKPKPSQLPRNKKKEEIKNTEQRKKWAEEKRKQRALWSTEKRKEVTMAPVRSRLEIQFRPRTCNSAHGGKLKYSNCSTAPLHRPLRIQLRSKAKRKNDEEYCNSANWRKRMKKNDPTKYKDILERDRLYSRVRNASLNEEQRARERVLTKERVRQFRQRKREKEAAEKGKPKPSQSPRSKKKEEIIKNTEQRKKWAEEKRKQRALWSTEKRKEVNLKARMKKRQEKEKLQQI